MKLYPSLSAIAFCHMRYLAGSIMVCLWSMPAIIFTIPQPQDWPQINGPDRNGVVPGMSIDVNRAKDPKQVWSRTVGQGFSGCAISNDRLIAFHRPDDDYVVECLDRETGEVIWVRQLSSSFENMGPDRDKGPKAVPLIHDGRIYVLGTEGKLACLMLNDGEVVWQKNVCEIYRTSTGYFGAGSSPVVFKDKLLLNVGGRDSSVVAFDLKTGEERWTAFDDRASYSSPIIADVAGRPVAFVITRLHLVALDPENGDVLYDLEFGNPGAAVNGAMPLFSDGHLFINAAYGVGAKWIDVTENRPNVVWENDESFSSQYSTPIYHQGFLYGTAGREDVGIGSFRCVEAASGKVVWSEDGIPVGHTFLVDDQLVLFDCQGNLRIIEPTSKSFNQRSSTRIVDWSARAMPAFADGKIYVRTNASGQTGTLSCFEIGQPK